jgi:hypothetical protein
MVRENVDAFVQAFSVDLRKPRLEVLGGELGPIVHRATRAIEQLDEWARDESVAVPDLQKSWSPTVLKRPKGVVLVVSCVSMASSSPTLHSCAICVKGPGTTPLFSACCQSPAPWQPDAQPCSSHLRSALQSPRSWPISSPNTSIPLPIASSTEASPKSRISSS